MPRPLRINYPNACYHVMNRGAGRKKIFDNNIHRNMFLKLLSDCHQMFNLKIYAYCLMDNHYHLLLSTPEANLSRIMRHLNGTYTLKYNRSKKTDGPLFRGRYKAQVIEEDNYLLIVSRYIHLNPVKANLTKSPADYKWSSYSAYLNLGKTPVWLSKEIIINQFSLNKMSGIKSYQAYVEEMKLDETKEINILKSDNPILGSAIFKEKILSTVNALTLEASASDYRRAKTTPSIQLIIEMVCEYYHISYESLAHSKRSTLNWPKLAYIYISRKYYGYDLRSIAQSLHCKCTSTISSACRKSQIRIQNNPYLLLEVNAICENIKNKILKIK